MSQSLLFEIRKNMPPVIHSGSPLNIDSLLWGSQFYEINNTVTKLRQICPLLVVGDIFLFIMLLSLDYNHKVVMFDK